MADLNERIQLVLDLGPKIVKDPKSLSFDEKRLVHSVYLQVTGQVKRKDCSTCLVEIYFELKSINKNQITNIMNKLFKLKDGSVIGFHGLGQDYTNANLTNKAALTILKKNPGCKKYFTQLPHNWEDLVLGYDYKMSNEQVDALIAGKAVTVSEVFEESPIETTEVTAEENNEIVPAVEEKIDSDTSEVNSTIDSPVSAEEFDPIKQSLEGLTKKDLQKKCADLDLPKKDWEKLNVENLKTYLVRKIKEA